MAKQQTEIEEAVVVEETNDQQSILVIEKWTDKLPEKIEGPFFVTTKDGTVEEHSLAVVQELDKEAAKLLKKATPETYNDKKVWESISELKIKARDQRTKLDNERKRLKGPWDDFFSRMKAATDKVGAEAKKVEDKLAAAITLKENWEAEQARIEAERIAKRTEQRKEELRALGGLYDVESGTFTFPYSEQTINTVQLETWDEEDWGNEKAAIDVLYAEEQQRIADEEAEKAAKEAEVLAKEKALEDKIVALRAKELKLEGFEFDEGLQSYKKNDVVIHVLAVKSMSDEDWDADIARANMEAVEAPEEEREVNTPEINLPPSDTSAEAPTEEETPFDPLASIIEEKVAAHVQHQEEVDGVVRVTLEFSNDQPYIDVAFKNTFIRMFPESLDDRATVHLSSDKISAKGTHEESGLVLLAVKK